MAANIRTHLAPKLIITLADAEATQFPHSTFSICLWRTRRRHQLSTALPTTLKLKQRSPNYSLTCEVQRKAKAEFTSGFNTTSKQGCVMLFTRPMWQRGLLHVWIATVKEWNSSNHKRNTSAAAKFTALLTFHISWFFKYSTLTLKCTFFKSASTIGLEAMSVKNLGTSAWCYSAKKCMTKILQILYHLQLGKEKKIVTGCHVCIDFNCQLYKAGGKGLPRSNKG